MMKFSLKNMMKNIKILSFTKKGYLLSKKIYEYLTDEVEISTYKKFIDENDEITKEILSLRDWTKENFVTNNALIFVGATGIAIRAISPFIKDKFLDPAVICIDEKGKFIIPILSGHVGGANEIAANLATYLNAIPVITTATDVNNKWAVDVWAKKNNLIIDDRNLAKNISAKILENKKILLRSDISIKNISYKDIKLVEENEDIYITYKMKVSTSVLKLVPTCLCLGVGCKKNMDTASMILAFKRFIQDNNIDPRAIKYIASIDIKRNEQAILDLADELNVESRFFSANELNAVKGDFTSSDFVSSIVKVDNVCERAACRIYPEKLINKTKLGGITMALSIDDSLSFEI